MALDGLEFDLGGGVCLEICFAFSLYFFWSV
jgi:hypothetical protein